ncbi:MAG: histidine phosphatase family protein [Bacilli bacterium]|nr:histidine phosphatase family protein [Bacilli bacterium]
MLTICLVRHGETDYNKRGLVQGRVNVILNHNGRSQAFLLREKIKEEKFDVCFSSPLIRAMQTSMILVGDRTLICKDDRLIDRCQGIFEGQSSKDYDTSLFWNYDLNSDLDGVEKVQDVFSRVRGFLSYLKDNYNNKKILIVSHGAIIRALYHILHETDLSGDLLTFMFDNCYYEKFILK